jgi:DnaJ-class molecular chaperone
VHGPELVQLKQISESKYNHVLHSKGITDKGDHIAEINVVMPQNLDSASIDLFKKLESLDPTQKLNRFDPSVPFYNPELRSSQ